MGSVCTCSLEFRMISGSATADSRHSRHICHLLLLTYTRFKARPGNRRRPVPRGFPSGIIVILGTIQRRLAWSLRKDDTHKSRTVSITSFSKKRNRRRPIPRRSVHAVPFLPRSRTRSCCVVRSVGVSAKPREATQEGQRALRTVLGSEGPLQI